MSRIIFHEAKFLAYNKIFPTFLSHIIPHPAKPHNPLHRFVS